MFDAIFGSGPPCQKLTERRRECQRLHGKSGERCLHEELSEKRCIAEHICGWQAKAFYERQLQGIGTCAQFAESFAYPENSHVRENLSEKAKRNAVG